MARKAAAPPGASASRMQAPVPLDQLGLAVDAVDASLLDIVDNVLNNGVVLQGELVMGLANIDLIYAKLSLLLCAVDRLEDATAARSTAQPVGIHPAGRARRATRRRRARRPPIARR